MTTMIQRSFTGGEIAPSLYARVDTVKHATGLKTCRNFMVMRHGGVTNRPGSIFITEVVDSSKRTRIIPFVFSNDQTYVLELGHQYIRIINGDEFVSSLTDSATDVNYATNLLNVTDVIYGFGHATAYVSSSAGYATNDIIFLGDATTGLNPRMYKCSGTAAGEIQFTHTDGTPVSPGALTLHPAPHIIMKAKAYCSVVTASVADFSAGNTVTVVDNASGHTFAATVSAVTGTEVRVLDQSTGLVPLPQKLTSSLNPGTIAKDLKVTTTYTEDEIFDIQFVQSADVITIVHPNHKPAELSRLGASNWTLADITFAPLQAAPTSVNLTGSIAVGGNRNKLVEYVVTALSDDTYEESLGAPSGQADLPGFPGELDAAGGTSGYDLSWTGATGAVQYNIYRSDNRGNFGFINSTSGTTFTDSGIEPDLTITPPNARNPFNATGDYPSAVSYFQQRRTFANTDNNPEKVWTSRSGSYNNFTTSVPLQSDDAITFTLVGREVNRVLHLLELGTPVVFTSGGEWELQGDNSGVLKPAEINPKQHSYNGSSALRPIIIGGSAIYIQARGSIVRDLSFDYQVDGYRGSDLTIFSAHLFDGYTFVDWAFQQTPHSIVWMVRDDGSLIGLTYVKEHQVVGWHRHDFEGGLVESICVVPDGTEDAVYMVVQRTIDGESKRYIERLASRNITNILDAVFLDCSLSYDGRNDTATTMTLSGGSTWAYDETITLTASASFFTLSEVGNQIFLTGADGEVCRFTIGAYTSATVVTGKPSRDVPASLQSTATATWSRAVDQLVGLDHLEGEDVSVLADGFVVANPNNPSIDVITVTNGAITLDRPYAVITVGLPIVADLETLDIDVVQGETISDKKNIVSKVNIQIESSRGIFAGTEEPDGDDLLEGLFEVKMRNAEGNDDPVELKTGKVEVNLSGEWNNNGRVFIRQIDPLPLSVLSIAPSGLYPFKQGG
jgi:hypothetical protein